MYFLYYLTDFELFDCNCLTNGEVNSIILFFRIKSLEISINRPRWSLAVISWNHVLLYSGWFEVY